MQGNYPAVLYCSQSTGGVLVKLVDKRSHLILDVPKLCSWLYFIRSSSTEVMQFPYASLSERH